MRNGMAEFLLPRESRQGQGPADPEPRAQGRKAKLCPAGVTAKRFPCGKCSISWTDIPNFKVTSHQTLEPLK